MLTSQTISINNASYAHPTRRQKTAEMQPKLSERHILQIALVKKLLFLSQVQTRKAGLNTMESEMSSESKKR